MQRAIPIAVRIVRVKAPVHCITSDLSRSLSVRKNIHVNSHDPIDIFHVVGSRLSTGSGDDVVRPDKSRKCDPDRVRGQMACRTCPSPEAKCPMSVDKRAVFLELRLVIISIRVKPIPMMKSPSIVVVHVPDRGLYAIGQQKETYELSPKLTITSVPARIYTSNSVLRLAASGA
jgi:hypothetical protein